MEKDCTKLEVAVLICAIALFVFLGAVPSRKTPMRNSDTRPPVAVQVEGEVARPGIYMLDRSAATVSAAAVKAGLRHKIAGTEAQIKLISGQSLEIVRAKPGVGIKLGRMPGPALLALGLKLDLNSASLGDLLLVPHLRPGIAEAIVARRSRRPWENVDDLLEIRGVGPKTVEKLHNYLEASDTLREGKRQK